MLERIRRSLAKKRLVASLLAATALSGGCAATNVQKQEVQNVTTSRGSERMKDAKAYHALSQKSDKLLRKVRRLIERCNLRTFPSLGDGEKRRLKSQLRALYSEVKEMLESLKPYGKYDTLVVVVHGRGSGYNPMGLIHVYEDGVIEFEELFFNLFGEEI